MMWQGKYRTLQKNRRGGPEGNEGGVETDAWISALGAGVGGGIISWAREPRRAEPCGFLSESPKPRTGKNRGGGEHMTSEWINKWRLVDPPQPPVWPWKRKMGSSTERNLKFQEAQWLLNTHKPLTLFSFPTGHMWQLWLPWCLSTRAGLPWLSVLGAWAAGRLCIPLSYFEATSLGPTGC